MTEYKQMMKVRLQLWSSTLLIVHGHAMPKFWALSGTDGRKRFWYGVVGMPGIPREGTDGFRILA